MAARRRFFLKRGIGVSWLDLSAGGMTVLNVFYNQDCCFDTLECGRNALKNLKTGNAYPDVIYNLDGVDIS